MLWDDLQSNSLMRDKFLELYRFARKPKYSIHFFLDKNRSTIFFLPLSPVASLQLDSLNSLIQNSNWDASSEDSWKYTWGSANFSTSKAYKVITGSQQASPLFKWLWATGNLGKHKFFFWLLLIDRLNTRNMLRRKNRHLDDYNCVFCNSEEETCFHLFFTCPFGIQCWNSININWDTSLNPLDMFYQVRITFNNPIFREIIITACWIIWTTRNGVIFDAKDFNLNQWKHAFRDELGLVCIRAKKKIVVALSVWYENFS